VRHGTLQLLTSGRSLFYVRSPVYSGTDALDAAVVLFDIMATGEHAIRASTQMRSRVVIGRPPTLRYTLAVNVCMRRGLYTGTYQQNELSSIKLEQRMSYRSPIASVPLSWPPLSTSGRQSPGTLLLISTIWPSVIMRRRRCSPDRRASLRRPEKKLQVYLQLAFRCQGTT